MLEAGYDTACYWMMDHVRTQTLRQEISELDESAAANIISYGIEPYTKWCGAYGLPDIRENGEDSLALGRARWFGVTSITATETPYLPLCRPYQRNLCRRGSRRRKRRKHGLIAADWAYC